MPVTRYLGADVGADIEKRAAEVFRQNRWEAGVRRVVQIGWDDLARLSAKILSGLLGRPIEAEIIRPDKSCWSISFRDSVNELHALFAFLEADEDELEDDGLEGMPSWELSQHLSCGLICEVLPFKAESTIVDSQGVWFISSLNELGKEI